MLFSSNRDPRIYFLPPISYVFVLHHTHIVVVSLNCLFFTHKYTARFTNMNEGGFGTRAGAARHMKRLFCFYFPEGIYIYISIKWLYILSHESKRRKDIKQKKCNCTCRPFTYWISVQRTNAHVMCVCVHVRSSSGEGYTVLCLCSCFFFLSCVMVNPWGLCECL